MIKIIVPADPDVDDCFAKAVADYVSAHPEAAGWDLKPRWADEDREQIELTVPSSEPAKMSDADFRPTHIITLPAATELSCYGHTITTESEYIIPVALDPETGALFTESEWEACAPNDWGISDAGLEFQGRVVDGSSYHRLAK